MKTCTKCGEKKPIDRFSKDSSKLCGLHPHCKTCRSSSSRKVYTVRKHRIKTPPQEKICTKCKLSKPSSDFHKSPSNECGLVHRCKTCVAEYSRVYRAKNKDHLLQKARDYYYRTIEWQSERGFFIWRTETWFLKGIETGKSTH